MSAAAVVTHAAMSASASTTAFGRIIRIPLFRRAELPQAPPIACGPMSGCIPLAHRESTILDRPPREGARARVRVRARAGIQRRPRHDRTQPGLADPRLIQVDLHMPSAPIVGKDVDSWCTR